MDWAPMHGFSQGAYSPGLFDEIVTISPDFFVAVAAHNTIEEAHRFGLLHAFFFFFFFFHLFLKNIATVKSDS
jgi:hypothetical protein